jgi:hypothetical protein
MTILEQLLAAIRAGGTFETGILAARLGVSPALVEAMLAHLQRSGYLRPYETCGDACAGCSLKEGCQANAHQASLRLWQL